MTAAGGARTGVARDGWPGLGALLGTFAWLLALVLLGSRWLVDADTKGLTGWLWTTQDWPLIVALVAFLLWLRGAHADGPSRRIASLCWPRWATPAAMAAVFAAGWAGHYVVMAGYDLSRDEQMVLFDAAILERGAVAARLSPDWAAVGEALNRLFTLPQPDPAIWVSAYLPGNATLHLMAQKLGDAHLAAPLLAALAVGALALCVRRLFPGDRTAMAVALGALVLSPQFILTAMTSYAMTAHLALNLVWLALFLRRDAPGLAGCLSVGFVATGLHQPVFHPLFVAPFLWLLWHERRWRPLGLLIAGYAVIGLFWLAWPGLVAAIAEARQAGSTQGFIARLMVMFGEWRADGFVLMGWNLLRFAAWQPLLLLPLVAAGVAACWRSTPLVRALAAAPVLTVAAMLILLPYQGHGWGYRYLHGLLGNLALLAAFGWAALRERGGVPRGALAATLIASAAAMLWFGMQAQRMILPYAAADARIAASAADYVLIDDGAAPFAQDLVFNPPWLDRRPIRLQASAVRVDPAWGRLCRGRSVAIVGADDLSAISRLFGANPPAASTDLPRARAVLAAAGCREVRQ